MTLHGYFRSSTQTTRFVLRLLLAALLDISPEQFVEQELAYAYNRRPARMNRRE